MRFLGGKWQIKNSGADKGNKISRSALSFDNDWRLRG
jgi:hypothetical protein